MLTAQECYEQSLNKLEELQTIDYIIEIDKKIKEAVEHGAFVTRAGPYLPNLAEKLGVELEEYGFATNVAFSGVMNEKNQPLCFVEINWRYVPRPSYVKVPASYN